MGEGGAPPVAPSEVAAARSLIREDEKIMAENEHKNTEGSIDGERAK